MKTLVFGEILWDVYPDNKFLGGAPLNFAAHLARHGQDVYMLSSLGNDTLGKEAMEIIDVWNIKTDYIHLNDKKITGKCVVTLNDAGIPTYNLLSDVAYDYINTYSVKDEFDVLYFGTLALRGDYNRAAISNLLKSNHFNEVFVDINIRKQFYSADTVNFSVENATILKISDEEMAIVAKMLKINATVNFQTFAKKLSHMFDNLKYIIITLGSKGAYIYDTANNTEHFSKCEKTDVVSTVGAGDSFSAAFLHQYICKKSLDFCMNYASKIAAYVVSKTEAVPEYDAKDFIGGNCLEKI